jgi:hypothetical protein
VDTYLARLVDVVQDEGLSGKQHHGDGRARFIALRLIGPDGHGRTQHVSGDDLVVRVTVESTCDLADAALAVNLTTLAGSKVFSGWTREAGFHLDLPEGRSHFECRFRQVRVRPNHRLGVELWMEAGTVLDNVPEALYFDVVEGPGTDHFSTDAHQGIVLVDYDWRRADRLDDVPAARG